MISNTERSFYEKLQHPVVLYSVSDGEPHAELISDGLCLVGKKKRDAFLEQLNADPFYQVYPDDILWVKRNLESFFRHETDLDVIFRNKINQGAGFNMVHAIGKWQEMQDGTEIAAIAYYDMIDPEDIAKNLNLQLSALADVYTSVIDINLSEDAYIEIVNRENLEGIAVHSNAQAQATLYAAVDKLASKAFQPVLKEFLDFTKLGERLKDRTNITLEFQDTTRGWCRGRMIAAERDEIGNVIRVLWAIESIDEEKRRRDELIRLAETDQMTGILNRASGEHKIKEQLVKGNPGMFMMLDIDHFKSINDRFGHSVGDQVIKEVAGCLRNAFRSGDIVLRIGGDEFAAFAAGVESREISDGIIGRFFKYLADVSVPEMKGEPVCVSVGIAFCPKDTGMDFREIYKRADQGVYDSKKADGNMVTYE